MIFSRIPKANGFSPLSHFAKWEARQTPESPAREEGPQICYWCRVRLWEMASLKMHDARPLAGTQTQGPLHAKCAEYLQKTAAFCWDAKVSADTCHVMQGSARPADSHLLPLSRSFCHLHMFSGKVGRCVLPDAHRIKGVYFPLPFPLSRQCTSLPFYLDICLCQILSHWWLNVAKYFFQRLILTKAAVAPLSVTGESQLHTTMHCSHRRKSQSHTHKYIFFYHQKWLWNEFMSCLEPLGFNV